MKKLLSVGFAAVTLAAAAIDIDAGTVGVTSISSDLTNVIIAVSYKDLAGTGNLKVADLVKTTNLTAGDKLYTFTGGSFECWNLSSGKVWEKTTKKYTMSASGALEAGDGVEAADVKKPVGTGIWLVRQSTTAPIVIYGMPSTEKSISLSAAGTYLAGNPQQSDSSPTVNNATVGDEILVPNNTAIPTRYRYNGSNWSYIDPSTHLPTTGGTPSIAAGTGFWYVAKGASTEIHWGTDAE